MNLSFNTPGMCRFNFNRPELLGLSDARQLLSDLGNG